MAVVTDSTMPCRPTIFHDFYDRGDLVHVGSSYCCTSDPDVEQHLGTLVSCHHVSMSALLNLKNHLTTLPAPNVIIHTRYKG